MCAAFCLHAECKAAFGALTKKKDGDESRFPEKNSRLQSDASSCHSNCVCCVENAPIYARSFERGVFSLLRLLHVQCSCCTFRRRAGRSPWIIFHQWALPLLAFFNWRWGPLTHYCATRHGWHTDPHDDHHHRLELCAAHRERKELAEWKAKAAPPEKKRKWKCSGGEDTKVALLLPCSQKFLLPQSCRERKVSDVQRRKKGKSVRVLPISLLWTFHVLQRLPLRELLLHQHWAPHTFSVWNALMGSIGERKRKSLLFLCYWK